MTIDMGESLGSSWLKHVKQCYLVQTNWKMSQTWQKKHKNVGEIAKGVERLFRERYAAKIFKENKSTEQIERQIECDIIGISRGHSGVSEYHVLEVAVHTKSPGLHYSGERNGKKANVSDDKVVAKLFNAAMTLYDNLDVDRGEIVFATPYVSEPLKKKIEMRLKDLQDYLSRIESEKGRKFGFTFVFIGNDDFKKEIIDPACDMGLKSCDDSECFLRAVKILQLAKDRPWGKKKGNKSQTKESASHNAVDIGNEHENAKQNHFCDADETIIELNPSGVNEFKAQLLKTHKAQFMLYYEGKPHPVSAVWNAAKITQNTDVLNNIRSRPFWRNRVEDGLIKAVVSVVE